MAVIFPRWFNTLPTVLAVGAPVALAAATGAVWYWFSPKYTDVGYMPEQPVPFSHKLHAGDLGMDCRYCHNTVEQGALAAVPTTSTCMNCHGVVRYDSPKLELVRQSWFTGEPIRWRRVHNLPDFVYFDHSIHVNKGVGCVTCHGRVDKMAAVEQVAPLTMQWCLDCHRWPERNLRPPEQIASMDWAPEGDPEAQGRRIAEELGVRKLTHCTACHR